MDRLISEKQVINAIKAWAIPLQVSNSETIEDLWVNGVCKLIKAIPSAEPNITWVTGADGAKIAFWDVPVRKVIKICEILGEPQERSE